MKITGKKHRHGGLAHAAFLTAHGDKDTSFAHRLPNDWLIIVLLSRPFLITPAPCTDGFPYHETVMSSRKHSRPAGPKPCRKNAGRLSAGTVPFSRGPDISGACHEKLSYLQYDLPFSSWHIDITSWWNVNSRNCRSADMGIFRWPGMTPFLYPVAKVWQMPPNPALVTSDVIRCHQMSGY